MASATLTHIPDSALNTSCFLACFKIYPPKPGALRLIEEMLESSHPSSFTPINPRPDYHSDNIFVARFDGSDEDRLFDAAPHIFRGHLIAVKKYAQDSSPSDYDFHVSPFWVRIYDLPLDCLNAQVAGIVASALGTNARGASSDEEIEKGSKRFARVRVDIDVSSPLEESLRLRLPNDEEIAARIVYERLPNYCDYCGLVGHLDDACPGGGGRVRRYRRSSLAVAPPSSPRMTPVMMAMMNDRRRRRTAFQSVQEHFRRLSGHS